MDRLETAVARATRGGRGFCLAFMDLDDFKPINDLYGHDVGDRVLREVGRRLRAAARRSDTMARLGGDEFACVFEGVERAEHALALVAKVRAAVCQPIQRVDGPPLQIGLSLGLARYPADGADPLQLMRVADAAMYAEKRGASGLPAPPGR